jgi:hypothetical protein
MAKILAKFNNLILVTQTLTSRSDVGNMRIRQHLYDSQLIGEHCRHDDLMIDSWVSGGYLARS